MSPIKLTIIFHSFVLFLLLKCEIRRHFVAADETTNLVDTIGALRQRLNAIYQKCEAGADLTSNIWQILEKERQNFFCNLNDLTNEEFILMEMVDKKWKKLGNIFLTDSPKKISELVDRLDSKKRKEFGEFWKRAENMGKLLNKLAIMNRAKFELLIGTLYEALEGTERAEYAKHVEKQSKALHVYSIYMKYAKEKVNDILGNEGHKTVHCEMVAKYDKHFEKFLQIMLAKFSAESSSRERLEEFVADLVDTCKLNTSYRQKAGSLLIDYKSHYKKVMLAKVPLFLDGNWSTEHFADKLCAIVAEYSASFLQNWVSAEGMGKERFSRYRAFIWRQILDKILKNGERINLDKFVGQLFGQKQFFELEKYDANFSKLFELARRVKSCEDKMMQIVMGMAELQVAAFQLFSLKHFLSQLEAAEQGIRREQRK